MRVSPRIVVVLLLFLVASMTGGVILAMATSLADRTGGPLPGWAAPPVVLACFATVFFLGRTSVLPSACTTSPRRALVALTACIGLSMALAALMTWALGPITRALDAGPGPAVMWCASLLAVLLLLERFAARRDRRRAPLSSHK
ncbi:MAG: hypothetical protein ACT4QD_15675 [Acidobacteriota bacterium]